MTVYYTEEHEWVRVEGDQATVGITDFAQGQLGDVVFVEVPEAGRALSQGGEAAVVDEPSLVNTDPEGEGWFFKLTLSDNHELSGLMNEEQYKAYCETL